MDKEWKKFFGVRGIDNSLSLRGLQSLEDAIFAGKQSGTAFYTMSYWDIVEPVYEYLVVFENNRGQFDMTLKEYYVSKQEFESNPNNTGWTCVELVQSTKRERKQ